MPDIVVPIGDAQEREIQRRRREVDNAAGRKAATQPSTVPTTVATDDAPSRIWIDPQLAVAIAELSARIEREEDEPPDSARRR
jgi:hypothetical protein